MTNPPQSSDDPLPGPGGEREDRTAGSAPQPQPHGAPGGPPGYGPPPQQGYGPPPQQGYGQPPGYGAPPQPGYGPPPQPGYGPPYGQPPQYGPPYGQPSPGAGRTLSVGLIAAVTAGIVALIALVVVLSLTLSSRVLDPAAVERDVAGQFEEREGVAIDLTCGDDMKVDAGATYECSGTTADGEDVTLQIRIDDEDAATYTWSEP